MFYWCSRLTALDVSRFDTSKVTDMTSMFENCSGLTSLDISHFNTSNVTNMRGMFSYCSGLTSLDLSIFDTSNVTNMESMFNYCKGLTSLDVSMFDTSNVTDMNGMFMSCYGLTFLDVSHFNTSNVTDMSCMFVCCSGLTSLDLSSFDTSNVTYMDCMFSSCSGLTSLDLSHFNTSNVTTMASMFGRADSSFGGCSGLTSLDLSNFDTGNVTNMGGMFFGCSGLTSLDLSNFDTNNVVNMGSMFEGCNSLTSIDLSHFGTSKVASMYNMFYDCNGLTSLDLSNFNTSNVTDMSGMFADCSGLTSLDLSNFDTSKVIAMGPKIFYYGEAGMFSGCSGLTSLDLSNFDTSNVTSMSGLFEGCSNLSTIYCGDLWNMNRVTSSSGVFADCTHLVGGAGTAYDASHVDETYAHVDGGPSNPGYLTHIKDKEKSIANSDDLQDFIDGLLNSGEKGTAESPKEIPVAKDGLTIDKDVDIEDDLQLLIDGEKSESGNVNMSFTGGTIKLFGTGGCWGFVCVGFYGNTASQAKESGSGKDVATTGIINNGQIDLRNCTLNEDNYQICNQGRLMLDGATVVNGKNLIKNLQGGRIFFTSQPQHAVTIAIPTAADVEEGQPIVSGSDGYTLTEADAASITLTVPDGYECNYDAAQNALVVTSTNGITALGTKAETVETYDLTGRKVERSKKGLGIQRMNNGIVKKIIIK